MTTRDKQLVRESFCAIREDAAPLSLLFYGRLFEVDPNLRPMFHGDIALQGIKLMQMLAIIVDRLDQFDVLTGMLHAMGQRHTAYGVEARHYTCVEQALIWSLGQALAAPAGSDVLRAWQNVIHDVSAIMIEGANRLSPASPNNRTGHSRIDEAH